MKIRIPSEKIAETALARKLKLEANIKKFYIYRIVQSMFFFVPISILFLLSNNLTTAQAFTLEAIYMIVAVIFAIPAGLFADNFGRKRSIFLSSALLFIACLVYSMSTTFAEFFIGEILWALSAALYSAVEPTFLYDTLMDLDRREDYKRIYGNASFITLFMLGLASLAGGYLAAGGLRQVFSYTLIPFFIAMFIPITFTEPHIHKSEKRHLEQLKETIQFSLRNKRVKNLIIYFSCLSGLLYLSFYFLQPYLKSVGAPLQLFGYVYIAGFLLEGIGAKFSDRIEKFLGEKMTLTLIVLFAFAGVFLMGITRSRYGLVFPLILYFLFGFAEPVISFYINEHVSSFRRATIMSIKAMVKGLVIAVALPIVGYIIDAFTLRTAIILCSFVMFLEFAILVYAIYVGREFEVSS